jgi:DNA polymerase-3 subunit delta'
MNAKTDATSAAMSDAIPAGTALYPWQQRDWAQLRQMRERLPHAILLHGPEGTGKVAFAHALAASLLCESPQASGEACSSCASCGWFAQYSHPDFRRLRPDALDADEAEEAAEGAADDGGGKKASSKAPSKDIRIEQVRALASFMNVSTHRSGKRIVLLYPAEALNSASANALLKTLEEPRPDTLFLLVTHRIDRLLPTILSRCRKFAMASPDPAAALAWLQAEGVKDADRWLAEQGGAPLAALAAAHGETGAERDELLALLAKPERALALVVADRLQKAPLSQLVAWMQRWLYDLVSLKLGGRVRYFPHHQKSLAALTSRVTAGQLQQALKEAGARRAVADHPLSARLFIEDMLLSYASLFR